MVLVLVAVPDPHRSRARSGLLLSAPTRRRPELGGQWRAGGERRDPRELFAVGQTLQNLSIQPRWQ